MTTPAPPPEPAAAPKYAGFWLRVVASLVDTLWVLLLLSPLAALLGPARELPLDELLADASQPALATLAGALVPSGGELIVWVLVPALLVLAFWDRKAATPGKMLIGAKIVDARTGGMPTRRQLLLRYLGYLLASMPFGLGLLWVGIDPRKQGWHDKLAGTVVVRTKRRA